MIHAQQRRTASIGALPPCSLQAQRRGCSRSLENRIGISVPSAGHASELVWPARAEAESIRERELLKGQLTTSVAGPRHGHTACPPAGDIVTADLDNFPASLQNDNISDLLLPVNPAQTASVFADTEMVTDVTTPRRTAQCGRSGRDRHCPSGGGARYRKVWIT